MELFIQSPWPLFLWNSSYNPFKHYFCGTLHTIPLNIIFSGAFHTIPLNIIFSGAFHTPLMQPAVEPFTEALKFTQISNPRFFTFIFFFIFMFVVVFIHDFDHDHVHDYVNDHGHNYVNNMWMTHFIFFFNESKTNWLCLFIFRLFRLFSHLTNVQ